MLVKRYIICVFALSLIFESYDSEAHDPVFAPGPHVLFKQGVEIHTELRSSKAENNNANRQSMAIKYGITGDWVAGIEVPYISTNNTSSSQAGLADVILSTKYRFWRKDSLGKQSSAAVLANVKLDSSNADVATNTTDVLLGLTYGFESLKWYRWASVRYLLNQKLNSLGRGNRLFVDVAGGFRPRVNDYRKPDTVLLLELNGELISQNQFENIDLINSGGNQWFISPGVMWTLRNFAIKAGVQIPIVSNLNGSQQDTDYRAFLEFELHL